MSTEHAQSRWHSINFQRPHTLHYVQIEQSDQSQFKFFIFEQVIQMDQSTVFVKEDFE